MVSTSVKFFDSILSRFPQQFSLVFAYGSSVFSQGNKKDQNNMIDFIFCVDNPLEWHKANMKINHKHYSFLKYGGADFVKNIQVNFGAKMYFNSLVEVENKLIKYGVISTNHLIEDLLDWQTLYISGRLHKPVKIIEKNKNTDVQQALQTNLQSALHASLLCLPETFSEVKLFLKIAELSYSGDFRMYFGEDKQKVENIVMNQVSDFRDLYAEQLKLMPQLHWNQSQCTIEQDGSTATTLHHLNLLPKTVQHNLLVMWNKDGRYRDLEDVLQSVAFDPQCSEMVQKSYSRYHLVVQHNTKHERHFNCWYCEITQIQLKKDKENGKID